MKKIIIDTTDRAETVIKLEVDGKTDELRSKQKTKSQEALFLIDKILKDNKIQAKDLNAIEVNTGPGSFTGTRVGVAIANALSLALSIPVNGKTQVLEPKYF